MSSEARKDELRMSWNKKVSMREIAQFYEDRLRELDAKQTKLMEDVNRKEAEFESKMQILENSVEEIKDFVQNIEAMKKTMERILSDLKSSASLDEVEKNVHALQILWKRTNEKVERHETLLDDLHEDLVRAVTTIAVNSGSFLLLQDLVNATTLKVDKDLLKIEIELSKDPEAFSNIFLADVKFVTRNLLRTFRMFDSDNVPTDIIDGIARTSVEMFLDRIKGSMKFSDELEKIPIKEGGASND